MNGETLDLFVIFEGKGKTIFWRTFKQVAAYLSSNFNNLAMIGRYCSICVQSIIHS